MVSPSDFIKDTTVTNIVFYGFQSLIAQLANSFFYKYMCILLEREGIEINSHQVTSQSRNIIKSPMTVSLIIAYNSKEKLLQLVCLKPQIPNNATPGNMTTLLPNCD